MKMFIGILIGLFAAAALIALAFFFITMITQGGHP